MKLYPQLEDDIGVYWTTWGPVMPGGRRTCQSPHHSGGGGPDRPELPGGPLGRGSLVCRQDVATEFTANYSDPDELVARIRARKEHIPDDTELDNPRMLVGLNYEDPCASIDVFEEHVLPQFQGRAIHPPFYPR